MMQGNLKISVVTATFNSEATLRDCLSSVARQTFREVEHIIVDGGSTDGTLDLIAQYRREHDVLETGPDGGIYEALNKGIRLASGDVIGFLHSDDMFATRSSLNEISQAFEDPAICGVYGDLNYVTVTNPEKILRKWRDAPFRTGDLSRGWMPAHPTLYVRKEWYIKIGGFDTSYRIAADYLSIIQLFSDPDFNATYIPKVLVTMRAGGASNKSIKAMLFKTSEDYRALRSSCFSPLQASRTLIRKNLRKIPQFLCKAH